MFASLNRMFAIFVKELTQLKRDRLTFGMVVMIPFMQLLLFGYTINTDVRNVPIALVDESMTSFSRQFIQDLEASQVVRIVSRLDVGEQVAESVKNGKVSAGLIIPEDIERRYYANAGEPLAQLLVDGSDTVMASALKSLANFPFQPGAVISAQDLDGLLSVTLLYNPEQRSALFTVPGLLGLILTMTMTMFTSIAIVRERERGNMELLIATPVKPIELMVGKLVPYMCIGMLQVAIILALGAWLFDVLVVGSYSLLALSCLVFIFANLGLGLLMSTKAPNQLGAMQMFIFFFLPSILLSGFMFPFVAMPKVAQWLAEVLPMTHFLRVIRGIVLRDAPFSAVSLDLAFLLAFFVVTLLLSLLGFRQKLD